MRAPVLVAALLAVAAPGALAHKEGDHAPSGARPADAPKGIQHHDHTPLHGGEVRMTGDEHVELKVGADGTYQVWFTDAWRRPLKDFVVGVVTIKSDAGLDVLPLGARGEGGVYAPRGRAQPGAHRKLVVTAQAGSIPIVAHYELDAPAAQAAAPVTVELTEAGFVPATIDVAPGQDVQLVVTRKTDRTCAKDIVVPGVAAKQDLPLDRPVVVAFKAPTAKGDVKFGCSMQQMVGGTIRVR